MGRPGVGNPGNKGGKPGASGRSSAYKEHQDAEWHADVWKNKQDMAALEARIASGEYSGRDMALLMLLKGNDKIVSKFMDKLVPDLHDVKSGGETIQQAIILIEKPKDDGNPI